MFDTSKANLLNIVISSEGTISLQLVNAVSGPGVVEGVAVHA